MEGAKREGGRERGHDPHLGYQWKADAAQMKALRFVSSNAREIERGRVRARGTRSETSTATLTATLTAPVSGLLWIVALSFEQLKRCWQLLLPLCGKLLAVVASKCWCLCVCVCSLASLAYANDALNALEEMQQRRRCDVKSA